jgi:hypothetical protein
VTDVFSELCCSPDVCSLRADTARLAFSVIWVSLVHEFVLLGCQFVGHKRINLVIMFLLLLNKVLCEPDVHNTLSY